MNMWNLGQFRENLIFCQKLFNSSSNLKILLHMCDTYDCDYLQHSTFRSNLRVAEWVALISFSLVRGIINQH